MGMVTRMMLRIEFFGVCSEKRGQQWVKTKQKQWKEIKTFNHEHRSRLGRARRGSHCSAFCTPGLVTEYEKSVSVFCSEEPYTVQFMLESEKMY